MKLLVTGAAGFIGSHYVRTMLAGGYPGWGDAKITVLDKLTYAGRADNLPLEHPQLHFVRGDVSDSQLLADVVPGHDAVVHFAAETHVDRSIDSGGVFTQTNVLGTQLLLEACHHADVERVVHVSTDEVYGSLPSGRWSEQDPLWPNSPYAASKAGADLAARAIWRTTGLDVRVTRCANNYGPHQHPEKLIPLFVTNLLQGRSVPLYGDGLNIREWLHVDDHCRAVQLVLDGGKAGEIYNIGGGVPMTNKAMTQVLLELCDADWSMVRHVADRKGHDLRYAVDDTKIRTQLGYSPRWELAEGLREVVDWYRDHLHRYASV